MLIQAIDAPIAAPAPDRPQVSVVVPFAGNPAEAAAALVLLGSLTLGPEDERILADNSFGALSTLAQRAAATQVHIVAATGERSPAHARNCGARDANHPWILFLDADTRAPAELVDRFFTVPVPSDVGAVAGDIRGVLERPTLSARFGARANFLDPRSHLAHPYRPRAAAANLLVRREALLAVGGFTEGVRAAEDTDFCWRLQAAGWRLDFRPEAAVAHRYRESLTALRRQWRAYAAGARWLESRWPGYHPDPALAHLTRVLGSRLARRGGAAVPLRRHALTPDVPLVLGDRVGFAAIQIILAVEEQVGLHSSNRLRT